MKPAAGQIWKLTNYDGSELYVFLLRFKFLSATHGEVWATNHLGTNSDIEPEVSFSKWNSKNWEFVSG